MNKDLDLPFEEIPGGPAYVTASPDSVLCGGVVIRAAAIDSDHGRLPALIFDFHSVDGTPFPPIVFVLDDPAQMRKLVALVDASVAAAIAVADLPDIHLDDDTGGTT